MEEEKSSKEAKNQHGNKERHNAKNTQDGIGEKREFFFFCGI